MYANCGVLASEFLAGVGEPANTLLISKEAVYLEAVTLRA